MNNNKEYSIFIDDSGNIELSSNDNYFIYGSLIFKSNNDIEKFKNDFKNILFSCFGSYKEKKASEKISWNTRKKILDCIINNDCILLAIVLKKSDSWRLKEIEEDYQKMKEEFKEFPLKAKISLKKHRKEKYGKHKSYLISEIICIIRKEISSFKKNLNFKIISDIECLSIPGTFEEITNYWKYEHSYLKYCDYHYEFKMEDSKNNICIQGADFLANSIFKKYNKNKNKDFDYINLKKKIFIKQMPYDTGEIILNVDKKNKNDNI